ncbi:MAG: hypothetical protein JST00_14650 [Deltaproteobacteria bacterium]|nr:hypothetical protein [Deltaproteobacteria bacterium]
MIAKRLSLLLLTASVAVGGGAALLNCAPSEVDDDDAALRDEDITGAANKLGLRLVYDDASGRVHATMKSRLRAGERLVLRVRRGRLTMDSQRQLDCSALPDAPAMEPRADRPGKVVYEGPSVDRSLLESVYTRDWIDGNITPAMLERLQREGADAIVEACIVKNGAARARLQTSLQYAWDQSSSGGDSLAPSSARIRFLGADGGTTSDGGAGDDGGATNDGGAPEPPREGQPIQSMERYAELCVAELGEIPFFTKRADGKYDTFDCRDFVGSGGPIDGVEGALIPQTVTDADGTDRTPAKCDDKNQRRYNCFSKCDEPEWLFQSCEPGPTVSTAKNAKGTHWTLLCRSTQHDGEGEETTASLTKTKRFNDIAMIGHDPKTGKTCYFQNKIFDGTDGSRIPHPADVEKSRHVWDTPKGYCMGCHSAEPFIHTPWIDKALRRDGTPIVPKMGVHADFEISWNASPYSVVNRKAQADARVGGGAWELPKHLVSEEADACTSCHRIGGGQGMRRFPMWAVGEEGLDTTSSGTSGPILGRFSDDKKRFERSHWMPPRTANLTEVTWPQSKYAKAVAHIKRCAENASAEGCVFEDVPERR